MFQNGMKNMMTLWNWEAWGRLPTVQQQGVFYKNNCWHSPTPVADSANVKSHNPFISESRPVVGEYPSLNSFQLFINQVQMASDLLKTCMLKIVFDILMAYVSPYTSDNQELRQCISYFFPVYCYSSPINQQNMQKVCFPHLCLTLHCHIGQPGAPTMPFIFLSGVLLLISRQPTEYAEGAFPSPTSCLTHWTTRSSDNAFHISFQCTATHLPSTNGICRRCLFFLVGVNVLEYTDHLDFPDCSPCIGDVVCDLFRT